MNPFHETFLCCTAVPGCLDGGKHYSLINLFSVDGEVYFSSPIRWLAIHLVCILGLHYLPCDQQDPEC